MALSTALSKEPAATRQLAMGLTGAGATVGCSCPSGVPQESEADHWVSSSCHGRLQSDGAVTFGTHDGAKQGGEAPGILSHTPRSQPHRGNQEALAGGAQVLHGFGSVGREEGEE